MNLAELAGKLAEVSDLYAHKFSIQRSPDWHLIKIQEEVGELCSAYLKLSGRARIGQSEADIRKNLAEEIADVIAMTLLFARDQGIDAEKDKRPFTRVIEWGRDFKSVYAYLLQNKLEALAFIPYQPRRHRYSSD